MRQESVDVVVIGSGIGGIAAARMLAEFGRKRVLVLEQHYALGGMTHEFERYARYHFATGVHYLGTGVEGGSPQAMLDYLSVRQLQWHRLPHELHVVHLPELEFGIPGDEAAFVTKLKTCWPDEAPAIGRYFSDAREAYRGLALLSTVQGLPQPVRAAGGWLVSKLFPLTEMTVRSFMEQHFVDPTLRALLSAQWGLYDLKTRLPGLTVHVSISRPCAGGTGPTGRIQKNVLSRYVQPGRVCHLCGLAPMMQACLDDLAALGVARSEIHTEAFVSPISQDDRRARARVIVDSAAKRGTKAYAVRLASGLVFPAVPRQTILQAAASAHVRMHQSCGEGVCGECKVRLKSGTAEADPCRLLSNKELANGWVLACEAMPTSDVELEPA